MDKISNIFYKTIITSGIAFEALCKTLKAIVDRADQVQKEADMTAVEKAIGYREYCGLESKGANNASNEMHR